MVDHQRPRSTRHLDALDKQVDTLRWWRSPVGTDYGRAFSESVGRQIVAQDSRGVRLDLATMEIYKLDQAPTFWVTGEMVDLTVHAAQSLEPQALRETLLPSRSGFVLFDKSIIHTDGRGNPVSFRAILWAPVQLDDSKQSGISISFYTDIDDPGALEGDPGVTGIREQWDSTPNRPPLLLLHYTAWAFDETWEVTDDPEQQRMIEPGRARVHTTIDEQRRFLMAFWTLIQMPLVVTEKQTPPRHFRKRAAAVGYLIPEIRVVTLRTVKEALKKHLEEGGDESTFEYSHRFPVQGHWRWQWYPSVQEHRQIWIDTFIKGPSDKPLVIKDTVYRWSR